MAYGNYARAYMGENLDSMPDYATALRIYESRKPYIKGKHKGERPLGRNRRHDRSRIEKDVHGNIRVKHWRTDIITYQPDGYIALDCGGWSSISTAQIMQELLGLERICRVNCKIYYRHDNQFYYLNRGLTIQPNGAPLLINPEYVHKLNPVTMKTYRKHYAFFLEYVKHVLTMSSNFQVKVNPSNYLNLMFEGETLKEWYMTPLLNSANRHDIGARDRALDAMFGYLDTLCTKSEDERLQAMYELLVPVTYMLGDGFIRGSDEVTWSCDYKRFKRGFDNLLKRQYSSQIFSLQRASTKSPVRDENAKYIRT